jgi:hypothetical protein
VSNDFTKYGMVRVGTNFNQRSSTISYWQVGISSSKWLLKDDRVSGEFRGYEIFGGAWIE